MKTARGKTKRMKMLSRPNGFMLSGKLGVNFFSTFKLLYPYMKVKLRLKGARPNLLMISDNPNVSFGFVDCSLYTCRFAPKDDYLKKRMDMLAYTLLELNSLETLAKIFLFPLDKTNSFKNTLLILFQFVELLLQ